MADEVGKRLDIQTIEHRPSIGKLDAASAAIEPQARNSLFSTSRPTKQDKPSNVHVSVPPANPLSAAAMRMPAYPAVSNPWADVKSSGSGPSTPRHEIDVQEAAAKIMERPQFIIDDVTDGDGDEDDFGDFEGPVEGDADLLNQVDKMLVEDEGTSGKAAQTGQALLDQDGTSLI